MCLKSALDDPAVVALRAVLKSVPWQQQLDAIAGYTPSHCGEVLSLRAVLPWWSFSRQKPRALSQTGTAPGEQKMDAFQWNPCFLTGLKDVDDQHHHLVQVINRFGDLAISPGGCVTTGN